MTDRALHYEIRPYHPASDFERACRLHDRARPLELVGSCDPRAFVPLAKDAIELAGFHASEKFVAEDETTGRMLGFVGIDAGCITWLYVHPKHHRRGVGRALLRHALARVGGDGEAWLITLAGNTSALALYKSEGFIVAKEFDGENAGWPCRCLRLERTGAMRS